MKQVYQIWMSAIAVAMVSISAWAQPAGSIVTFPPTTLTSPYPCTPGFDAQVPGADLGSVFFYWGAFFTQNGVEWFGTGGSGGCSNFVAIQFGPKATGVSLILRNFGATDTITVNTSTGAAAYSIPSGGEIAIVDPGPTLGIGVQSRSSIPTFAISELRIQSQSDGGGFMAFARFKTPGTTGLPEYAKPAGTNMAVNIPLGAVFSIGLEKKQGFLDPLLPVVSAYTVSGRTVAPAFSYRGRHLFRTTPVLDVGAGGAGEERTFIAVHLGKFTLAMTPLSIPGPPVTLNVNIVRPSALGTAELSWDKAIIDAAHERGIPPQMIKGQIAQESGNGSTFTEKNFRYEPCGADVKYISRGATKINNTPYSLYALESARGLTLLDQTIEPRNKYYIIDGTGSNGQPTRRLLTTADTAVTAKQIWDANDTWPPGGAHGMRWSRTPCAVRAAYIAAGNLPSNFSTDMLDFVAQTPTASSYGVMQIMYDTAIDRQWDVVVDPVMGTVSQDPYFLFDVPANLRLERGGSIPVGSALDADHFPSQTSSFADVSDIEHVFTPVFQQYNPHLSGYGSGVISHSHAYLPFLSGQVFP